MRQHLVAAALLAGLAALPIGAVAQEATPPAQLPETDMRFAQDAASGGIAEVELGRMATDKAASAEVQEFGGKMADDHGKANDQLKQIAEQLDITLPGELQADAMAAQERLDGLSDAEFDRAYVEQMAADHENTVALFRRQADIGQVPELKDFTQQALPVLEQHLEQARQIDAQLSEMAGTAGEGAAPAEAAPEATEPAAGAGGTQQAAVSQSPFGAMTADELIGTSVINPDGDEIGKLRDVVINRQDQAVLAVIGVGGILGIGDKDVAVPFEDLRRGDGETIVLDATEEELNAMPTYGEQVGTYDDFPADRKLGEDQ